MSEERVKHPKHYQHPSGVECIDIIKWENCCIGAAMKYLWRAGRKPGVDAIEDLEKAKQFIDFEIGRINEERDAARNTEGECEVCGSSNPRYFDPTQHVFFHGDNAGRATRCEVL